MRKTQFTALANRPDNCGATVFRFEFMNDLAIPCMLMRGGTSKGPLFLASDLPVDAHTRDDVLLSLMGSPDVRQRSPTRFHERLARLFLWPPLVCWDCMTRFHAFVLPLSS